MGYEESFFLLRRIAVVASKGIFQQIHYQDGYIFLANLLQIANTDVLG